MRTNWDPLEDDINRILSEIDEYVEAGVTHFVPEPRQKNKAEYMSSVEILADLFSQSGIHLSNN